MNNSSGIAGGADTVQAGGGTKWEHVAETAEYVGTEFTTADMRALEVDLVMTTVGTGSVAVVIERYEKASKTWLMVLTGAAVITDVVNRYKVSPDLAAAANSVAQDHLGEVMRIRVTHANANPTTYSLGYSLSK